MKNIKYYVINILKLFRIHNKLPLNHPRKSKQQWKNKKIYIKSLGQTKYIKNTLYEINENKKRR